jgi:LPXTG-site transpeptidase (sortase) family protein
MEKLSKIKKLLILLGVFVAVFVILDFGYFWANVKFFLYRPSSTLSVSVPVANLKIQPNLLIIDSLGLQAPIQYPTTTGETAFQAALINGVVHYPGTANPGELGNCYIFGHSSDYIWSKGHYKNVFAVLPQIKKSSDIVISDQQGNEFNYTVIASHEVATNDVSVLSQQNYQKKLLTLQTSYPVGTALARWIVVAEIK